MSQDQVAPRWRKSASSATSGCVEVADGAEATVLIRDSKNPDGVWLRISATTWRSFLAQVKADELG